MLIVNIILAIIIFLTYIITAFKYGLYYDNIGFFANLVLDYALAMLLAFPLLNINKILTRNKIIYNEREYNKFKSWKVRGDLNLQRVINKKNKLNNFLTREALYVNTEIRPDYLICERRLFLCDGVDINSIELKAINIIEGDAELKKLFKGTFTINGIIADTPSLIDRIDDKDTFKITVAFAENESIQKDIIIVFFNNNYYLKLDNDIDRYSSYYQLVNL